MFKPWTICPRYQLIHRPWQAPVLVLSKLETVLQPTSGHPEVAVRLPCFRRMDTA